MVFVCFVSVYFSDLVSPFLTLVCFWFSFVLFFLCVSDLLAWFVVSASVFWFLLFWTLAYFLLFCLIWGFFLLPGFGLFLLVLLGLLFVAVVWRPFLVRDLRLWEWWVCFVFSFLGYCSRVGGCDFIFTRVF